MSTSGAATNGSAAGSVQQQLPLRSALKNDDETDKAPSATGSSKAVQISEPTCENPPDDEPCVRQFRAAHTRRLSGKPASQRGVDESGHPTSQRQQYYSEKLLAQVGEWLDREKKKLSSRSTKKSRSRDVSPRSAASTTGASPSGHQRSDSIESQSSQVSLDKLQHILEDTVNSMGLSTAALHHPRMPRVHRRKRTGSLARAAASSDSEYVDGDAIVPDCDVWVDNSKTLAYTGTQSEIGDDGRLQRDPEAWITFKNDILRTAHTLRLKGWRRVPLEAGETIGVQRLSGALTNAVYVVTPPADLPRQEGKSHPKTVLLRIYGPQVEHLIDREKELQILQRLARKRIGPRLLGTFRNGRFEQYFHASPLTPSDLRDPETSRQIAKRMRELHDGIELLPQEREAGPTVFRNFDQWLDNAGRIVRALDKQYEASLESANQRRESTVPCWKDNGYACGAPWDQFQDAVARCRAHLEKYYNDRGGLNDALVFAHNDTQYGNILRSQPDDEKSPLLQPANKHKQLIVIDFEYASANVPGQELANHFTEWTYNYHDDKRPWACNVHRYPTPDEQRRFAKAYIEHHAGKPPGGAGTARDDGTATPVPPPMMHATSSSSIVDFMLDSRAPPGGWCAAEKAHEESTDRAARQLLDESRMWRPANSAMWAAWGVVQAKIDDDEGKEGTEEEEEPADEFDYILYAQDRALFFWGDVVQMGLVDAGELPESLRTRLKIVEAGNQ